MKLQQKSNYSDYSTFVGLDRRLSLWDQSRFSTGQTSALERTKSLGQQQRKFFWKGSGQEGSGQDDGEGGDSPDSANEGNGAGDGSEGNNGDQQGGAEQPPRHPTGPAIPMVSLATMNVPEVFTPLPVIAVQRNPVFPKFIKIIEVQQKGDHDY